MSSDQKQCMPGRGWIHSLRLPLQAFNSEVSFDPQQLPFRLTDRRTLVVGKVLIGITAVLCLAGSVIWWESKASHAYLRTEGIPGEAWADFILAIIVTFGAVWFCLRYDEIEITGKHVRVHEHRPFGGREWTATIGSYRGIAAESQEFRTDDSTNVWTTWTLKLVHADATRDVVLHSVKFDQDAGILTDHRGRQLMDSQDFEKENLILGARWAQTMGLPLLVRRDEELVEKKNAIKGIGDR